MISHIDPKNDYVFKRVFGIEENVAVLLDVLNAVLRPPPDRPLVDLTINNPFNPKDSADDKLSVVDVKASDAQGRRYNVEMQMFAVPAYPERVLHYWAKIYAEQLGERDTYDKLEPTISISFLNFALFPDVPDFHLDFQLRSSRHPELLFSDVQAMHVIELPKFRKSAAELMDALDGWCYFLKNAADLDSERLPQGMQRPAVQRAMEVLDVISKTDLEKERYEARVRLERDQRSLVQAANDAHEKGRKEGMKEGIAGRIHLCQRLLKLPQTPREDLLALSIEELEAKIKALEQQVVA